MAQKKKKGGGKKKKPAKTTQTTEPTKTDTSADPSKGIDLDAPGTKADTTPSKSEEKPAEKTEGKKAIGEGDEGSGEEKPVDDTKGPITLAGALGLALPIGSYNTVTGLGIGLYFDGEYKLTPEIRPTLRLGLQYHFDTTRTPAENLTSYSTKSRAHAIPLLVGARFFPMKEGLYLFAETGIFIRFVSETREGAQSTTLAGCQKTDVGVECSTSKVNLGIGAGGGYVLGPIDIHASFHSYDLTTFGARMAVGLTGGYRFANF